MENFKPCGVWFSLRSIVYNFHFQISILQLSSIEERAILQRKK